MLKIFNLSKLSQIFFIIGLLLLVLAFIFSILNHQGAAAKVITTTFFCFVIGTLFYFLDLIKNKLVKSD